MKYEKRADTHLFDRDISLVQKDKFFFKGHVKDIKNHI